MSRAKVHHLRGGSPMPLPRVQAASWPRSPKQESSMAAVELPTPPVPPDCDVRGFTWMPFYGGKLFASELYMRGSAEGFRVACKLWWEAWQQCPAGSLPNDDIQLCMLADLGRDLRSWKEVREEALHGFVLCSDGRLYHPLVCAAALASWETRKKNAKKVADWRARRAAAEQERAESCNGYTPGNETGSVTSKSRGDDRTGEDKSLSSCEGERGPAPPPAPEPPPKRTVRASSKGWHIPDDWALTPQLRTYALERGHDPDQIAEAFVNYWRSAAGPSALKRDWDAAFRTWVAKEGQMARSSRQPSIFEARSTLADERRRGTLEAMQEIMEQDGGPLGTVR